MLGFVNGQIVSTVSWQATTLAGVGVVVGVPLGLVVGRTVWNAFANNLGVVPETVVPLLLVAAITVGVLVGANLIAIAPAWVATRSKAERSPAARRMSSFLAGRDRPSAI